MILNEDRMADPHEVTIINTVGLLITARGLRHTIEFLGSLKQQIEYAENCVEQDEERKGR